MMKKFENLSDTDSVFILNDIAIPDKEKITPTVNFSNIKYIFGFRTSIFKKLHEGGTKRAIFTTRLSGEIADNLSLEICNTIKEIISCCKNHDISPLFAFLVPVSDYDQLIPKLVVPKNTNAILNIIRCCAKLNYRDGYLGDIDILLKQERNSYLVGENFAHYEYSPHSMRPFTFEHTKATHTFSKDELDWGNFGEFAIGKYDFFYYNELHLSRHIDDIERKQTFSDKCKKYGLPFVLLDNCFDTLYELKYYPTIELAENCDYGTASFKKYVFCDSIDWLYDEVDINYEMLYNEIVSF